MPASPPGTLADRLTVRRSEIEHAILVRVNSISDPDIFEDPEYVTGLRRTVRTALCYAIAVIQEKRETRPEGVPAELIAQARLAARSGVHLDTVLRRYLAGNTVLGEFVMSEAKECLLNDSALRPILRAQAELLDRIVTAVSAEHRQEVDRKRRPSAQRRIERVEALLAGEPVDTAELTYHLDGWHLGVITTGHDSIRAVRELAAECDRRVLAIERDEMTAWAWLGGLRKFTSEEVGAIARQRLPSGVAVVLGEPGHRLDGWRLTHQQARAALPIALQTGDPFTRYASVSLLASVFQDEVLSRSLKNLYLSPLAGARDGGAALRTTLRTYLTCDRNSTSTAAALGVSRQTINNRLRNIERKLGHEIASCASELDLALRMEEMENPAGRVPWKSSLLHISHIVQARSSFDRQ